MPDGSGRPVSQQAAGLRQLPVQWRLSAHARRLLVLALTGIIIAVVTSRPEFAGLAAPALVLLGTWRSDRSSQLSVGVSMATDTLAEGVHTTLKAEINGHQHCEARLLIEPADTVIAGDAVTLASGQPARAAVLWLVPTRWGRYSLGTLVVTFTDRYHLFEGNALVHLPQVTCWPDPARLGQTIVQSRLPSRLG